MTCLTRRRCRAALFALRATATSDPLFRCAVVLEDEDSQLLITHSATCFLLLCCSARCLASCLSRGLSGTRGKLWCSARLCAVCLLRLHSALDLVARRAALKYAGPC